MSDEKVADLEAEPEDSRAELINAVRTELLKLRSAKGRIGHHYLSRFPTLYLLSGADNTWDAWHWLLAETTEVALAGENEGVRILGQLIFSSRQTDIKARLDFVGPKFGLHPRNARSRSDEGAEALAVGLVEASGVPSLSHRIILTNDIANTLLVTITTVTNVGRFLLDPVLSWDEAGKVRLKPIEQSRWVEDGATQLLFRQVSYRTRIPQPVDMIDGLFYCLTVYLPSRRMPDISVLENFQNLLFKMATTYSSRGIQFDFHPLRKGWSIDEVTQFYSTVRDPSHYDASQFEVPYIAT